MQTIHSSSVGIVHGLPFIGFGFLDNFLMIIMGDYIEGSIGVYFCLSTMAAAALGNTISDVLGLGLAHYVEQCFAFLGMKEPKLTPTQLKMGITQRFASLVSGKRKFLISSFSFSYILLQSNRDEWSALQLGAYWGCVRYYSCTIKM